MPVYTIFVVIITISVAFCTLFYRFGSIFYHFILSFSLNYQNIIILAVFLQNLGKKYSGEDKSHEVTKNHVRQKRIKVR